MLPFGLPAPACAAAVPRRESRRRRRAAIPHRSARGHYPHRAPSAI